MRKILFVITQSEFGGAQRFLHTLATHLPKEQYNVLIATGRTGDKKFTDELHKAGLNTRTFNHLVRNPHPFHDLMAVREMRQFIKKFPPDILFLCSSKAGVIGSVAAGFPTRLPNLKVIYRIGGWSFNDPGSKLLKQFWKTIEKQTAKYKDVIILNNRHDFDQAKKLNIKPKQLSLVHNGLNIQEMSFYSREEARKKLNLLEQDLVLGTIANFYPAKGLEQLLNAVHMLPNANFKLVIIGDGNLRAKIEQKISKYNLGQKVLLTGRLDDARRHLKAFDIYIQPSLKEGFPWAVLEAMGAGLPIIATSVGAIPEIIKDRQNGLLVSPGQPDQLADKIRELTDSGLREKLGQQAFETVSSQFSLEHMIEEIKSLL